jgi:hypothetical protein
MKHHIHTSSFVLAVQFWIAILVANGSSAANTPYLEYAKITARTVVSQITSSGQTIPGAKHFVISIEKLAAIVDNIKAVMRFVPTRKAMNGTQNHP